MNLREYQGRELFARYGIPVLPGQVASTPEEARDIAASIAGPVVTKASDILLKLWRVYSDGDCQLAEINPLAITPAGKVLALDAKVILDDNAEYRHRDWEGWRDRAEETMGERLAREKGLSYVK